MVSVKDVPADALIRAVADILKREYSQVRPPEWAFFVKTGPNKERPPMQDDWWYIRAASILRKLYIYGPVGASRLRSAYSYRAKVGDRVRSERTRKAGGAIIRKILQQLESAGLVQKTPEGRVLTPAGKSLLDRVAAALARELAKQRPELAKYYAPRKQQ